MKTKLDLRQQVGQLLIMGFDGTEMSPKLRTMISTLQPGGVILFRRNIEEAKQTYELVRESAKSMKLPGFLCVDLEGGTVDRLRDLIAPAPTCCRRCLHWRPQALSQAWTHPWRGMPRLRLQYRLRSGPRSPFRAFQGCPDLAYRLRRSQSNSEVCPRIAKGTAR